MTDREQNIDGLNVAIIGASGGIGAAFIELFSDMPQIAKIFSLSRRVKQSDNPPLKLTNINIDITSEQSVSQAMASINSYLDVIIIATGILHSAEYMPEKSFKQLDSNHFQQQFNVNSIGPAIVLKHIISKVNPQKPALIAVLSARVGSIADNKMGGWYAYRASKAALHMIVKNYAIELARKHPKLVIASMHPGTVDSSLSKPYQANVKEGKLFTPDYAARKMWQVLQQLTPIDSGKIFAYDGSLIEY